MPVPRHRDWNRAPLDGDAPDLTAKDWRFEFKLSPRSDRDTRLAQYIKRDLQGGANVSALVKRLLLSYYIGAPMPGVQADVVQDDQAEVSIEDADSLAAALAGVRTSLTDA